MKKLLVVLSLISLFMLTSCFTEKKEEEKKVDLDSKTNNISVEEDKTETPEEKEVRDSIIEEIKGNIPSDESKDNTESSGSVSTGETEDPVTEELQDEIMNDINNIVNDLDGEIKK